MCFSRSRFVSLAKARSCLKKGKVRASFLKARRIPFVEIDLCLPWRHDGSGVASLLSQGGLTKKIFM